MADTPIVSSSAEDAQSQGTLVALQALLERHVLRMDELKSQLKQLSESMKSIVENDAKVSEAEEKAKEVTKEVKERKKTLTESPEYRQHRAKSAELKDELKELEESMNTHLLSYYDQTKVKVFDTSTGAQREFKITARVLPKKGGKDE